MKASHERWSADLCKTCPAPEILQANACDFLRLRGRVIRPIGAALQRRVQVAAYCEKVDRAVAEPMIGCGECHPLPPEFFLQR